ncbi:unnamed protein product, partial [Ascophyllum nodosum]
QTARRTRRSATTDRPESRGSSSRGQVASRSTSDSGTLPRPSVAARPSGASTAAPATAAASPTCRRVPKRPRMMSASSGSPAGSSQGPSLTAPSAEGIASPRRVFKRPRMMRTSSSTARSPSSPPPP